MHGSSDQRQQSRRPQAQTPQVRPTALLHHEKMMDDELCVMPPLSDYEDAAKIEHIKYSAADDSCGPRPLMSRVKYSGEQSKKKLILNDD